MPPIKPNIGSKTDFAARPSVPSSQKENATEFNLLVSSIRANYERIILRWSTDISVNENLPVGQYVVFTDDRIYRVHTAFNVGSPITWDASKVTQIGGGDSVNIYNSDGALEGDRAVDGNGKELAFINLDETTIQSTQSINISADANINISGGADVGISAGNDVSLIPGSGDVRVNNTQVKDVSDPSDPQDAATKSYVDAVSAGIVSSWKAPVKVATTVAVTLATSFENGDTIDGITLVTGDRILIKNQASASENGIYIVNASGAPTRSSDADIASELEGIAVSVQRGTANADTNWLQTTDGITLGSSNLIFIQLGATTPAWSTTTPGTVELSDTSEAQNIVTRAGAGSSNSSNSDARTPSEKGLVEMLLSFIAAAWTWAAKQTFTTAPRFSSTTASQHLAIDSNKDLISVPSATQAKMITGTDDTDPATAKSVEDKGSVKLRDFANNATGSSTVDCQSQDTCHVVYTVTVTGNITIALSNASNLQLINITIPITGSNIQITMPSSVRMKRNNEVVSGDGWYQSTKILQVSSVGTADTHEISLKRKHNTGPVFTLEYGGPERA